MAGFLAMSATSRRVTRASAKTEARRAGKEEFEESEEILQVARGARVFVPQPHEFADPPLPPGPAEARVLHVKASEVELIYCHDGIPYTHSLSDVRAWLADSPKPHFLSKWIPEKKRVRGGAPPPDYIVELCAFPPLQSIGGERAIDKVLALLNKRPGRVNFGGGLPLLTALNNQSIGVKALVNVLLAYGATVDDSLRSTERGHLLKDVPNDRG